MSVLARSGGGLVQRGCRCGTRRHRPVGTRWFRSSGVRASHTFIALSESGRKLLWNALGALASVQSHASWDDHPAHRRARSGASRRHAAATLTIEPLLHSDMLIGQRDGRRLRNWQLVLPFATTYRTGSRVSVPRPTASLLMALPWYGKDDGSFIGKIGTGPKPEARNRLRGV